MQRLLGAIALTAALAAGCGGDYDKPAYVPPPITKEPEPLPAGQAQPAASGPAAAFTLVPDGPGAQARLGYVDGAGLESADLPLPRHRLVAAVLGRDAAPPEVRVGSRTVAPSEPAPERSAIRSAETSAVQQCLNDTFALTILGPAAMGRDAAIGAGLAESGDEPSGLKVRICGAPHLIREARAMQRSLERAFPRAVVGETEVGVERHIVSAAVPVEDVGEGRLVSLLSGGDALHAVSWR